VQSVSDSRAGCVGCRLLPPRLLLPLSGKEAVDAANASTMATSSVAAMKGSLAVVQATGGASLAADGVAEAATAAAG